MSREMGTPAEAIAFPLVTNQLDLGFWVWDGSAWMLGLIPNQNSAISAHGCNDIWILRLVSSLVDFAWMGDLLNYVEFHLNGIVTLSSAIPPNLARLLIVIFGIRLNGVWQLDIGYLKIVGLVVGGVGAK
jgi:hypothetical protein